MNVHVHCAIDASSSLCFARQFLTPHIDHTGPREMLNIHTRRVYKMQVHYNIYHRKLLIVLNFSSIYNTIYLLYLYTMVIILYMQIETRYNFRLTYRRSS